MTAFAALFRRELTARWPAIAAALVMGFLVALMPPFVGATTTSPAELRGIASAVVLYSWSALLALLVGATLFSREVVGGSFAFRLPVPGFSHWAARLTAALALLGLSTLALLSPSILFGVDVEAFRIALAAPLPASELGAPAPLALLLVLAWLLVLALANAFALALRTRNAWSTLDLVSAVLLALAIFSGWRTLREVDAPAALWLTKGATALLLLPGLLIAGVRQISIGRGEADRAQRAHSIVLLVASLLAAAGTVCLARWYASPSLKDLYAEAAVVEPIGGNRAVVRGPIVNRVRLRARFLLDLVSGESHRLALRPGKSQVTEAQGSADGSRFGWFETDWSERPPHSELVLYYASRPGSPELTAISAEPDPGTWALSPNANRVALLGSRASESGFRVIVKQVSPPADLRSVPIEPCHFPPDLSFASESRLVVECFSPGSVRPDGEGVFQVYEVDIESGAIVSQGEERLADLREKRKVRVAGETWRTVQRCDGSPCQLVSRKAKQEPFEVFGVLDQRTGLLRGAPSDGMLKRRANSPSGITLLTDRDGRWIRFDPAAGELVPVFPDALYDRSERVYG